MENIHKTGKLCTPSKDDTVYVTALGCLVMEIMCIWI